MANDEDILETALNSGVKFSENKHSVNEKQVLGVVRKFKKEIGDDEPCMCEEPKNKASGMMCFMCEKQTRKERINI